MHRPKPIIQIARSVKTLLVKRGIEVAPVKIPVRTPRRSIDAADTDSNRAKVRCGPVRLGQLGCAPGRLPRSGTVSASPMAPGLAALMSWQSRQVSSPRARGRSAGCRPRRVWQSRQPRRSLSAWGYSGGGSDGRLVAQRALVLVPAGHARGQVRERAVAIEALLVLEARVRLGDRRSRLGDLVAVQALRLGIPAWPGAVRPSSRSCGRWRTGASPRARGRAPGRLDPADPPVSWQSTQLLLVGMWARPIAISSIDADGDACSGWPARGSDAGRRRAAARSRRRWLRGAPGWRARSATTPRMPATPGFGAGSAARASGGAERGDGRRSAGVGRDVGRGSALIRPSSRSSGPPSRDSTISSGVTNL